MTWKEIKEICYADNAECEKRGCVPCEEDSPAISGFEKWKIARRSAWYDEREYSRGEGISV